MRRSACERCLAKCLLNAFCAFTSAATLLGVGLNTWLGWWWADPAAAVIIAALAVRKASKPGNSMPATDRRQGTAHGR